VIDMGVIGVAKTQAELGRVMRANEVRRGIIKELGIRAIEGIRREVKEKVLDLSKRGVEVIGFSVLCERMNRKGGVGIFVISGEQARVYGKQIEVLRGRGLRFMISREWEEGMIERGDWMGELDGVRVDMSEVKGVEELKGILGKMKESREGMAGGIDKGVSVVLGGAVIKSLEELSRRKAGVKIYEEYNILPMTDGLVGDERMGVAGLMVSGKGQARAAMGVGRVMAISSTDENVLSWSRDDVKEEVNIDSGVVRAYMEGVARGERSKVGTGLNYTDTGKREVLRGLLSLDIKKLLPKDFDKRIASIKGIFSDEGARDYIEYLVKNKRGVEAIGFMRGLMVRGIKEEIAKQLREYRGVEIDMGVVGHSASMEALAIRGLQLRLAGKGIVELVGGAYTATGIGDEGGVKASDVLRELASQMNAEGRKVIRDNENRVVEIKGEEEIAAVREGFKRFIVLIEERYGKRVVEGAKGISVMAVRFMLQAA
jgi:hypothetical protein